MPKELINMADEQQMFHLQHSRAFVNFAALEQQLADLVTLWSDQRSGAILFQSFYGIETFRSKLEFVDRFMLHHLEGNDPAKDAWKNALEACKKAAVGRNKLAHWYMSVFSQEKPGRRFVLVPPAVNPSAAFSADGANAGKVPGYALTIHGIATIAQKMVDAFGLVIRAKAAAMGIADPISAMAIPGIVPKFEEMVQQFENSELMLRIIRDQP